MSSCLHLSQQKKKKKTNNKALQNYFLGAKPTCYMHIINNCVYLLSLCGIKEISLCNLVFHDDGEITSNLNQQRKFFMYSHKSKAKAQLVIISWSAPSALRGWSLGICVRLVELHGWEGRVHTVSHGGFDHHTDRKTVTVLNLGQMNLKLNVHLPALSNYFQNHKWTSSFVFLFSPDRYYLYASQAFCHQQSSGVFGLIRWQFLLCYWKAIRPKNERKVRSIWGFATVYEG